MSAPEDGPEKSIVVGDLLAPLQTSERNRGLQVTINLEEPIEKHLNRTSEETLQRIGTTFLHDVLREAQQLAMESSKDLNFTIEGHHIDQATRSVVMRLRQRRTKWAYLQAFSLTSFGAGASYVLSNLPLGPSLGLVVIIFSVVLFFFSQEHR